MTRRYFQVSLFDVNLGTSCGIFVIDTQEPAFSPLSVIQHNTIIDKVMNTTNLKKIAILSFYELATDAE